MCRFLMRPYCTRGGAFPHRRRLDGGTQVAGGLQRRTAVGRPRFCMGLSRPGATGGIRDNVAGGFAACNIISLCLGCPNRAIHRGRLDFGGIGMHLRGCLKTFRLRYNKKWPPSRSTGFDSRMYSAKFFLLERVRSTFSHWTLAFFAVGKSPPQKVDDNSLKKILFWAVRPPSPGLTGDVSLQI